MTVGSRLPDPERKRLSHGGGECETPLRKVGRNHLLATYLIKGIVASLAYAVS